MALLAAALGLLPACTTTEWNRPRNRPMLSEPTLREPQEVSGPVTVALSFSGGGLRAAAFAQGVLEGLAQAPSLGGRSLLDEVSFITAVSGGSLTAAYYGLNGPAGFDSFRTRVLAGDGESSLLTSFSNPLNLLKAVTGGLNDGARLTQWLDREVFAGATFGDLYRRGRPAVWINATNIQHRLAFPFHERAFEAICSDLASFPVSEAVAASMAVPVLFPPVVLEKFADRCTRPLAVGAELPDDPDRDDQRRLRQALQRALADFRSPATGRYLKLVDGGITDNLGLVSILQSRVLLNTPYGPISAQDAQVMRRVLFVVVNAGQGPSGEWGQAPEGPPGLDVAGAAVDTAIDSAARLSYGSFLAMIRNWERDIVNYRCALPPAEQQALRTRVPGWRCDDVRFSVTQLGFSDLPPAESAALDAIPTRLKLPPEQVARLLAAGRSALASDRVLQAFVRGLREDGPPPQPQERR